MMHRENSLRLTKFRLTSSQLDLIRPGFQVILCGYEARRQGRSAPFQYPSFLTPPIDPKQAGSFDQAMMEQIVSAFRKTLRENAKSLRLEMNDIELRAMILAARIHQDHRRYFARRNSRSRRASSRQSAQRFKRHLKRLITTLERHLKRATRESRAALGASYKGQGEKWRAHLRWVRHRLANFKPTPPVRHSKRTQKAWIDELSIRATEGVLRRGYHPPTPNVLRHQIRLFLQYARRGRAKYLIDLHSLPDSELRYFMAHFLINRFELTPINPERNTNASNIESP